jgi:uncharacterized protein YndB with AHSA1/START domain
MAEFQIEREVVIDAPVAVVWRTITEPEQIRQWFADRVELELEPGGRGLMGFEDRALPLFVDAVEPPTPFLVPVESPCRRGAGGRQLHTGRVHPRR